MRLILIPTPEAVIAANKYICEQGALVAIVFLNQHGLELDYPLDEEKNINGLAETIESCAAGNTSRDELMDWFASHKAYLED